MRYNGPPMSAQPLIAVLVEELLFRSKIETTARQLKIGVANLKGDEGEQEVLTAAASAALVVLDLNHKKVDAIEWLKKFKGNPSTGRVPVLGFLSHVQADLKKKAVEARCDLVVPRSVFSDQLAHLLTRYTKARLPDPVP